MARSRQEVFAHHVEALGAGDLDGIVADYADDAVFISPTGVLRGPGGIRAAFTQLLADLPNASWDLKTQIYEGDVLFLEWGGQRRVHPVRRRHRHVRVPRRPDPDPDRPVHAAAGPLSSAPGPAPV